MTTNKSTKTNTSKQVTPKKPAKPRAKQIKLSHIEAQQKAVNKMEVFVLDEEQNLQIKYYPIFSEHRIGELLQEAHRDLSFVEENKLNFFVDENQFIKYIYFLIIRKFTSLESEISDDFGTKVHIMNQIIEIGLFRRLYDEVFNPEEILKIMDRLQEFVEMASKITEMQRKELEKAERLIVNKDVLHPLVNPTVNPDADSNG